MQPSHIGLNVVIMLFTFVALHCRVVLFCDYLLFRFFISFVIDLRFCLNSFFCGCPLSKSFIIICIILKFGDFVFTTARVAARVGIYGFIF